MQNSPSNTAGIVGTTPSHGRSSDREQRCCVLYEHQHRSGCLNVIYSRNGEITAPLSPTITSSQLKTALDGFVGIDNVSVSGSSGSFTLTFGGSQALTNVSQVFGDAANAANGSTTRTITTAYNAADELISLSDPSSTISYTRDALGRSTAIANTVNGLTPTVTLNQSFDSASNRTELKATSGSANDFKNTYQFDALQRLTDIVQESQSGGNAVTSKHVTLAYNVLSQRTNLTRYQSTGTTNGVATTDNTYDTINRLSTLTHKQGTTTLAGYTYGYDGMSRPTSVDSTIEGVSTFTYDATSQVTAADHATQTDETYGFDANGNRNSSGYTTSTNNQTTAGLGFTFTFDDEGNRLTRTETSTSNEQSYEWDYRNRLVAVKDRNTSGGSIVKQVNYEYDSLNRLVHREYDADGAGSGAATNQYWVYDEGIDAILQFDGSAASTLSHRYLWSNQVDELLADEQVTSLGTGGNTLWGLADHLGTLRDIADFNEGTSVTSVTNHRSYNAFGKLTAETNSAVDMFFGYTGKQLDEATGLQHNLNRWYDSSIGRWISEDPSGFAAGDENVSRYVKGNVLKFLDPSGLVGDDQRQTPTPTRTMLDDVVRCAGYTPRENDVTQEGFNHLRQSPRPRRILPDLYVNGRFGGTPVSPVGDGLAIALGGEFDNPLYADYVTDPEHRVFTALGGGVRRVTTDLPDNSVSDISMRNVVFEPQIWEEILRIAMPGCVLTVSGPREYWLGYYMDLRNFKIISGYQEIGPPLPAVLPSRYPDGRWSPSPSSLPNIIFTIRLGGNETLL